MAVSVLVIFRINYIYSNSGRKSNTAVSQSSFTRSDSRMYELIKGRIVSLFYKSNEKLICHESIVYRSKNDPCLTLQDRYA